MLILFFNQDFPVGSLPVTTTDQQGQPGSCSCITGHPCGHKQNLDRRGAKPSGKAIGLIRAGNEVVRGCPKPKRFRRTGGCDAPVAERVGNASSPEPSAPPNGAPLLPRDTGVALRFCDGPSQLRVPATASFGSVPTSDLPARVCAVEITGDQLPGRIFPTVAVSGPTRARSSAWPE